MKKWITLALLCAAMFIIVIDTTIMNVSISALVEDLDTTVGGIQAAISLYALVMASFMLVGGKLGEIVGAKKTFIIGLVLFGIGTATASFATNLAMLIVGWSIVEGIGSALMLPNTQTLLRSRYEGADRALGYGLLSAVGAVGAALGPIIGGYLTTYHSWRWAFRFEVAIVIIVLAFSGQLVAAKLKADRPRFDYPGALLTGGGMALVVLGVLLIQDYGIWTASKPFVIGGLEIAPFGLSIVPFLVGAGALLVGVAYNYEEKREEKGDPGHFRPALLHTPGLLAGMTERFIQMAMTAGTLFLIPLLFQLSFDFTAMETGVALLPFSIGVLVFAIGGARLSSRFEARRIIQVGLALSLVGLVSLLVTVQPDVEASEISTGFLVGAGIGLIASQILNLVLSRVGPDDTPETAGVNGTFEQLGNAMGVALVGTVMIVTLGNGMAEEVRASEHITPELEQEIIDSADEGIDLISDTQLQEGLESAGVSPDGQDAVVETYRVERTNAFKAGIAFLAFLALIGLVISMRLPRGKLVDEEAAGGRGEPVGTEPPGTG